jgi:hypothetical protein
MTALVFRIAHVGIALMVALSSCAGSGTGTDSAATTRPDGASGSGGSSSSTSGSGLEVRELFFDDRDGSAVRRLPEFVRSAAGQADDIESSRLRRNGLRLVEVSVDDVNAMVAAMGVAIHDTSVWHGQAAEWRDLQSRAIGPQSIGAMIDGVPQRFEPGQLVLGARGWTLEREDGPRLELELRATHQEAQTRRGPLTSVFSKRREPREEEMWLHAEVLLAPGSAMVLVAEDPDVEWPLQGEVVERRTRRVGPDGSAPSTIGQLLLGGDPAESGLRRRTVLIFIPRFPEGMFAPAEPAMSSSGSGEEES